MLFFLEFPIPGRVVTDQKYAFQHLEATSTFEILQNKVGQSSRCPQNTYTNKKFHIQTKFSHDQQKISCPTKFSMPKNSPMTNQNLSMSDTKKIFMSNTQKKKNPHHHKFFFLIPMSIKVSILTKQDLHIPVGKYRPRLIELISFNLKLLIRFIMNKPY